MSTSLHNELISIFNYFLPIIIAGLTAIIFSFRKNYLLAFLMIAIGLCIQYGKGLSFSNKDAIHGDSGVTIITHSLMSSNKAQKITISNLIKSNPDFLALQEIRDLNDGLRILKENGYEVAFDESKHTVFASLGKIENFHFNGNILVVNIKYNGSLIRFWVLHAPKFTLNIELHNRYFNDLFESLSRIDFKNDEYVDIVLGDFNSLKTGYWRENLQLLGFKGALSNFGSGLLNTFPAEGRTSYLPGLISIDEIYIEGSPEGKGMVGSKSFGSDHYPVIFDGDIK